MKTYTATAYNITGHDPVEWLFTTSQELPYLTRKFLNWCIDLATGDMDIDHSYTYIKIYVSGGDLDRNILTIFLRSWQDGSRVYCDVYYVIYYRVYHLRTMTLAE